MYTRFSFWVAIGVLFIVGGCRDVFEQDISGQQIILFAPSDGYSTSATSIELVWEDLPDAYEYQIQIVNPDFNSPDILYVDSLTQNTRFVAQLQSGSYAWRVRGVNAESSTEWSERTFQISSNGTISGLSPLLVSPQSSSYLNSGVVSFSWEELEGADYYALSIHEDVGGFPEETPVEVQVVESTAAAIELAEGLWWWRIRAYSNTGEVSNYTQQTFTIDLTEPLQPELITPIAGEQASGLYTFSWEFGEDLNAAFDSLWVASDSEFTEVLYSIQTEAVSEQIELSSWDAGSYYWRVVTYDSAGNASLPAETSFVIP